MALVGECISGSLDYIDEFGKKRSLHAKEDSD